MMIGSGSLMHMIASLKMNKRERTSIFKQDNSTEIYTKPLLLKKATRKKRLTVKKETDRLQEMENIRKVLAFFFTVIMIIVTIILI